VTIRLKINVENPQPRHLARAAQVLAQGGLVIYPTDTAYGLGCDIYSKRAIERIYLLKHMDRKRPLSFVCADLSDISRYAAIDNAQYRILRYHLPGPYTFILPATKEVPKILTSRTRTVGIRVPKHPVCMALVSELGHPLVSTTTSMYLHLQNTGNRNSNLDQRFVTAFDLDEEQRKTPMNDEDDHEEIFSDPDVIEQRFGHGVDLILDVGVLNFALSSIVDLTGPLPSIVRQGIGELSALR